MDLITLRRDGEIAVVTLNNPPVNALSVAVRQGLWDMAEQLDADPQVKAVVLICAGKTFVAGADVREFNLSPAPPHLPDLVNRLEAAVKPWVAAMHGSALGGGFELAMGCRFRIALNRARIGLPEVTLGIIPGASGTVRTPRLCAMPQAVDLVISGKPLSAVKAHELGLIDALVTDALEEQAIIFARQALSKPLPPPASLRPITKMPDAFWAEAATSAAKLGYQAPLRALECLRFASEASFAAAMRKERETFLELRASDEAAALRYVFFAERGAMSPAALKGVSPRPFKTIGVIGGGTMGAGIAVACRDMGAEIILIERDKEAVARGLATIAQLYAAAVKRGKLSQEGQSLAMAGIIGTTDYTQLAACELVIEAVFEDLATKRAVFDQLGQVCQATTVLATNTSYLDPRSIAQGVPHPERVIGLHFFSPAQLMRLLEIVPTPETAQDVLATAFALADRLGKIPVQAGICEGFIGNRILKRYRAEAEALVESGVSIAAIDESMRAFGMKMGPFEAQDLGGLDIAYLQREGARAAGKDIPETLGDILVRAGRKGQKTLGGWYDYRQGSRDPQPSPQLAQLLASRIVGPTHLGREEIVNRLLTAMALEGQAILDEGIAQSPAAIDLVEIHGYGFPRWKGGPMWIYHQQQSKTKAPKSQDESQQDNK